jgi:hypothetical protein
MKRIVPFVFIAFAAFGLLGIPSTAFSQALPGVWDRTYGGAGDDAADSIVALADGGLVVAGETRSKGVGGHDMWMLRLDEAGNVVWDQTYGGAKHDSASSIVALADVPFTGEVTGWNQGGALSPLTHNGTLIWVTSS